MPVSYTHLDVYKRQIYNSTPIKVFKTLFTNVWIFLIFVAGGSISLPSMLTTYFILLLVLSVHNSEVLSYIQPQLFPFIKQVPCYLLAMLFYTSITKITQRITVTWAISMSLSFLYSSTVLPETQNISRKTIKKHIRKLAVNLNTSVLHKYTNLIKSTDWLNQLLVSMSEYITLSVIALSMTFCSLLHNFSEYSHPALYFLTNNIKFL